jgi:hypothetical protein
VGADEFAYVEVEGEGVLSILQSLAPSALGNRRGPWAQIASMDPMDAQKLSERVIVPVVHCVLSTTTDVADIHAFVGGRCVRELSAGVGFWEASGRALAFENHKALRSLAARNARGSAVDPYDVIDAFLGLEPAPAPVKPKPKKAPLPRRRAPKGIVAMPGPTGEDLPDEERFKVPASWAMAIDHRRGGWFAEGRVAVDVDRAFARAQAVFASSPWAGAWRSQRGELQELTASVRARFEPAAAPATLSVLEEAATAVMLRTAYDTLDHQRPAESPLVELWVGARGLGFAVECTIAALGLGLGQRCLATIDRMVSELGPGLAVVRSVRRHLAAAREPDYLAARDHCAALRGDDPHVPNRRGSVPDLRMRILTSYLFPAEEKWLSEAVAAQQHTSVGRQIACWLDASRRVCPFDASTTFGAEGLPHVPAMVESLGRGFEEHLEREIAYLSDRKMDVRILGEALAAIPTDHAMQALFRWKHLPLIAPHAAVAILSYPERAARLGVG